MDKEMLAKLNEVLKAKGRRELSLEEMGQVVGGLSLFNQEIRTEEDVVAVCGVAAYLEQIYSRSFVAEWIMQETNDNNMMNDYRSFGVDGLYQRLCNIVIRGHEY